MNIFKYFYTNEKNYNTLIIHINTNSLITPKKSRYKSTIFHIITPTQIKRITIISYVKVEVTPVPLADTNSTSP